MMLPYAPWLCWLIPLAGAALVPLVSAISGKVRDWFSVAVSFIAAAFAVSMIPSWLEGITPELLYISFPLFPVGVLWDGLSIFMSCVVTCIGALIVLYSVKYMEGDPGLTRYYFFILLFIGGMTGLVMADNLVQLYIFWEVVGLCSYALIGHWYHRPSARRAAIKAFLVTRVGDVFLLLGIALLYSYAGTFRFAELASKEAYLMITAPLTAVALLMFGGAVGKSAQLPLHVWLPDAMEGPTTVSALIHAATMVKAGVYLVARIYTVFPHFLAHDAAWLLTVGWIGGITSLMAATMAVVSMDAKRVLAYSTISQIGFMFLALGVGGLHGWYPSQFHLMSHAIFKALLFLSAGCVIHALHTTDMREMGGMARYMPITSITALMGVLSLGGVPPFSGFWSKSAVLAAALEEGCVGLFVLGIIVSAITLLYSIRWYSLIFLGKPRSENKVHEAPPEMTIPLIILAIATVVAGATESFLHPLGGLLGAVADLHVSPVEIAATAAALGVGGYLGWGFYVSRMYSPESITKTSWGSVIYRILVNGYYFDHFYDRVFVRGFIAAWRKVRLLQTGFLSYNMYGVAAGLIILALLLLMLGVG